MGWLVRVLGGSAFGLVVALLPSPERGRLARETGLDAALCSFGLGMVQGTVGLSLYLIGGLAFTRASALDVSSLMLGHGWPGLSTLHLRGAGMLSWLAWIVTPVSWPAAYLALGGLVRVATFAITREAVGEPIVLIAIRSGHAFSRWRWRRRVLKALGPVRPDRVSRRDDGWVVVSCRPKPDWDEVATIDVDGRHFRVASISETENAGGIAIVYRLVAVPDHVIVRRLIRYRPPPDRPDAGSPAPRRE